MDSNFFRKVRVQFFLLLLTFGFVEYAEANYPIIQISHIVNFPSRAIVETMGLAFLAIVLIEALVLKKFEKLSFSKALRYSFLANLFSTALGILSYPGTSVGLFTIMVVIGSGFLTGMVKSIAAHGQYKVAKRIGVFSVLAYFVFVGLGFLVTKLVVLTIPGGKGLLATDRLYFINNFEVFLAVVSALGLLFIGYLISVISEGYIFTKIFPKGHRSAGTLLKMNLLSYLALLIMLSPNIKSVIERKSWWFHSDGRYNTQGNLKKENSLYFSGTINGEWKNVIESSVEALTNLNYGIKMVWPDDKFHKRFKDIETNPIFLNEENKKRNLPTSIQISIKRENEQTNIMHIEIFLRAYESDDGYFPDLSVYENSNTLSGPIKEILSQSWAKNEVTVSNLIKMK